jgi:hypothetical protein
MPNEGRQWQNLLGCNDWALFGSPELTMVGFCNLVGVGIGPLSKKLAVKYVIKGSSKWSHEYKHKF